MHNARHCVVLIWHTECAHLCTKSAKQQCLCRASMGVFEVYSARKGCFWCGALNAHTCTKGAQCETLCVSAVDQWARPSSTARLWLLSYFYVSQTWFCSKWLTFSFVHVLPTKSLLLPSVYLWVCLKQAVPDFLCIFQVRRTE